MRDSSRATNAGRQIDAAADGRVEALADQVHLLVVEVPVGQDRRVAREKVAHHRQHVLAPEGLAHAHLQRAGGLAVVLGEARHRLLQRGERPADLCQEALAALGQREPARAALEQPHAQPRFEPRDVLADRRRREPEAPRGGREAAASALCTKDSR
jgi:hypothetical protein